MRKQTLRDWLRRAAIVLLLVSALLLLRHTGYYAGIRKGLAKAQSERTVEAQTESALPRPVEAMHPLTVMVSATDGGGHYGAAYDAENTAAVLLRFSANLGEALGSAGAPLPVDETRFRACLSSCGVSFQFACPIPLELLSGWLGMEMSSPAAADAAQQLCLCVTDGTAELCYRTETGECFVCSTAVNPETLRKGTAEYAPNGAIYAWESERLGNAGDAMIPAATPAAAVVKSAVTLPRGGELDALLQAMGMNSFLANSYTEADGTVVYVSDEMTLRIAPSGEVFFRRAGTLDAADGGDLPAAVSRAWQTAERSAGLLIGDGALLFAGARRQENQRSYTVLLDYIVDGIPVRLASGHAAEIVLRGDTVIQARLQLRSFTRTGEQTQLLPALQAAAIAAGAQGRSTLVYADAGDATECMWVLADG